MTQPLSKTVVIWAMVALVLVMLSAPTIVVLGASFTSGKIVAFPPDGFSLQWYRQIAAASDLPVCIYNNPGTTHFTFSTALLARLATLPTVGGVKMPLVASGDYAGQIAELRAALPKGFSVGYSVDWVCAPAMLAGADAFYSVAAGLWPDPMLRLVRGAAQQGDVAEVGRIDATLAPL
mgnify:CR=1 FL=1